MRRCGSFIPSTASRPSYYQPNEVRLKKSGFLWNPDSRQSNSPQDWLSPSSPGGLQKRGLLDGESVHGVHHLADVLPCHDIHIAGEEHAARSALSHRLDEGVLDLREGSLLHDSVLVLDDLGILRDEERIVAGVRFGVAEHGTVLVRFLRGIEPGAVAEILGRVVPVRLVELLLLLLTHAEGGKHTLCERVPANEHPNDLGVQTNAQGVVHRCENDIRKADATVLLLLNPNARPHDLVHHGEAVLGAVAVEVGFLVGRGHDINAVGLTIRNDHQSGDLNVVGSHPILHKLRHNGDRLHGGRTTQAQSLSTGMGVLNNRTVQEGESALTIFGLVRRRAEIDEFGRPNHHGVGTFAEDVTIRKVKPISSSVLTDMVLVCPAEIHIVLGAVDLREPKDLKRNLRLLAEPNQLQGLKEASLEVRVHRPAEVKHEHDAVVLAVLLDDLADEDIVVGAVLVEAVKVQHPGLLGTLTPDLVRSLPALKLRDQLAHKRIGLLDELPVGGERTGVVDIDILQLLTHNGGGDDALAVVLQPGDDERCRLIIVTVTVRELLRSTRDESTEDLVRRASLLALWGLAVVFALSLALLLALHLLQLLHDALHGGMLVDALGNIEHLIESLHGINHVRESLLLRGEVQVHEAGNAPLHVGVEAVDEVRPAPIHLRELEQVSVHDLLVAQEEVAAGAGVLRLHQLFDADIFDGVGDLLKQRDVVALLLALRKDLLMAVVGSPQGVTDLMRDKHGLHDLTHLPHGHDEVAALGVERGGFRASIERERNVLGGESAGKDGERGVHARIVTDGGWKSIGKMKFFLRPITLELSRTTIRSEAEDKKSSVLRTLG